MRAHAAALGLDARPGRARPELAHALGWVDYAGTRPSRHGALDLERAHLAVERSA
jgi:hypothetical protein